MIILSPPKYPPNDTLLWYPVCCRMTRTPRTWQMEIRTHSGRATAVRDYTGSGSRWRKEPSSSKSILRHWLLRCLNNNLNYRTALIYTGYIDSLAIWTHPKQEDWLQYSCYLVISKTMIRLLYNGVNGAKGTYDKCRKHDLTHSTTRRNFMNEKRVDYLAISHSHEHYHTLMNSKYHQFITTALALSGRNALDGYKPVSHSNLYDNPLLSMCSGSCPLWLTPVMTTICRHEL